MFEAYLAGMATMGGLVILWKVYNVVEDWAINLIVARQAKRDEEVDLAICNVWDDWADGELELS